MEPLEPWIARQYRHSASAMMRSVSPTGIVKTRPGFGQIIRPLAGAIVASPELAAYDPEPDYFFHWHRDSAIVIDAVRLAAGDAALGIDARRHIEDFVRFSRSLQQLDGRVLVAQPAWRERIATGFHSFVRPDSELADLFGTAVDADTRFNPDGSIDISRWGRPQMDGPALRALALLRWSSHSSVPRLGAGSEFGELLQSDLAFVQHRWREASFDIWEEEKGQHYYTLRVAAARVGRRVGLAATGGRGLMRPSIAPRRPRRYCARSTAIGAKSTVIIARASSSRVRSRRRSSISQSSWRRSTAAATHRSTRSGIRRCTGRWHDSRPFLPQRTRSINSAPAHHGVAMGRYADDVYYSGGAYFFSTLGAAEFCYRAAPAADSAANGRRWRERGDAFLNTVRRFTPDTGDLSEQFDQRTGEPRSARNLAWSYAAFISCIDARRRAQDTGLGSTS